MLIIGELACGRFRDRRAVGDLLNDLPSLPMVDHHGAMAFLEQHDLVSGVGWIDVHLLASARRTSSEIWTRDGDLAAAARKLKLHVRYGQT